jgi:chemotaxis protein MotB
MALSRRGANGEALSPWPGYVDALSTLLMVIIFVLLVFVLAQAFLSVALTGRDQALDRLNRQMAELSDMLSLERGRSAELRLSIAQLNKDLQTATSARDTLSQQLAALRAEQEKTTADRDALKAERDKLSARLADTDLQTQAAQARNAQLEAQLADAAKRADTVGQEAAATAAQLADAKKQLAAVQATLAEMQRQKAALDQTVKANKETIDAKLSELAERQTKLEALQRQLQQTQADLDEMRRQKEALDQTVKADKATIEARLSDLATMAEQIRALQALRDDLEKQAQDAAVRATTEEQRRAAVAAQLADEKKFSDSARAQIALMTRQIEELRAQLATVQKALDLSEAAGKDKDVQIANLGQRLNAALAQKVEELQRYRSEFFGKLRQVLANRPGIQIVGDRFVFQSEVLFPVGSADLTQAGQDQINQLAVTLKDIAKEIPPDVNWILRVDGHADRQPLDGFGRFTSNWELSAGRAITVVKLLIADGISPSRLAATGFADYQPLDPADTPEAYAKNRRIEIRLTDR